MTAVEPVAEGASLPPSDTLEPLPDDFWASNPDVVDRPRAETPIMRTAAAQPAPPRAAPTRAAPTQPNATAPSTTQPAEDAASEAQGGGIAMVQRLFPGRVLTIEPHALGASDAGDGAERTPTVVEAESDEGDPETGLESR